MLASFFFWIPVLFLLGNRGADLSRKHFPLRILVLSWYDFATFSPSSYCSRQRSRLEKGDPCLTLGERETLVPPQRLLFLKEMSREVGAGGAMEGRGRAVITSNLAQ